MTHKAYSMKSEVKEAYREGKAVLLNAEVKSIFPELDKLIKTGVDIGEIRPGEQRRMTFLDEEIGRLFFAIEYNGETINPEYRIDIYHIKPEAMRS
jgi:hypothetical protein